MTVGRLRWCLVAVLAVCLTAAPSAWARPAAAPGSVSSAVPELGHRGAFLTDQAGRVVFLHGVNVVDKLPPYVAPDTAAGFTARDADFLAAHGFNAVRLGVLFAGVMPQPGQIDQTYLAQVDRIVQLLTARKIWVLLDFHQDAFNEKFHGEGFPAWAVHDDGLPFVDLGSFFANDQTPAVQHAYDHVWNDDYQLWDYYTQAWVAVAKKWAPQPYLMGYDLFNEPNAGSKSATCANPAGCPQFDAVLQRFYDHVRTAIRTVDPHHMVWYEPQFLFNALSASNFTHVDDPAVGLSWHDYACTPAFVSGGVLPGDPDCQINEPRVMDNAAAQEAAMGAGGLLTEFGAEDDLTDIGRLTQYADQHLTGWLYWAYKEWNDPTGSSDEGLYGNDADPSTVKAAKVALLSYPYPQAMAGTPMALSWDAAGRVLSFSYRPNAAAGLTDVFVGAGTYPNGYQVTVTGGSVRSGGGASHVLIAAAPQASKVTVVVGPQS